MTQKNVFYGANCIKTYKNNAYEIIQDVARTPICLPA